MRIELRAIAVQAADFLKVERLLDLACAAVANIAKGVSLCIPTQFAPDKAVP